MDNREKVRKWVLDKYNIKRIKGFNPYGIAKALNITIEEVYKYCGELATEDKILELRYYFECDCEFSKTYGSLSAVPGRCEWCEKEIDCLEDTIIHFAFKRE